MTSSKVCSKLNCGEGVEVHETNKFVSIKLVSLNFSAELILKKHYIHLKASLNQNLEFSVQFPHPKFNIDAMHSTWLHKICFASRKSQITLENISKIPFHRTLLLWSKKLVIVVSMTAVKFCNFHDVQARVICFDEIRSKFMAVKRDIEPNTRYQNCE